MKKSFSILLAEDRDADSHLFKFVLKGLDTDVHLNCVKDGVEAIEFLRNQSNDPDNGPPNLTILDLNLPRKSGLEVLKEMKSHAQWKRIPVIVLTTSNAPRDIVDSYDLQASAYLQKPLEMPDFKRLIELLVHYWSNAVTP